MGDTPKTEAEPTTQLNTKDEQRKKFDADVEKVFDKADFTKEQLAPPPLAFGVVVEESKEPKEPEDPKDPKEPEEPEEPKEPSDETTKTDPDDGWKSASSVLISMGLSVEEIDAMPVDLVLKMGKSRESSTPAEEVEPVDDETTETTVEKTNKDATDEDPVDDDPEHVSTRAEVILEALTESTVFDEAESSAIANAIEKAMGIDASDGKIEELEKALDTQREVVGEMIAQREAEELSSVYPEIKTKEGRATLFAVAGKLYESGVKFNDPGDLLKAAAFIEWGQKKTDDIATHQKRIDRLKNNGSPSTGNSITDDDTLREDDFTKGFNRAWDLVSK